ncbi:MAG: hypothetical protein ABIK62_05215 [candidate division WOR-3 bacterium]
MRKFTHWFLVVAAMSVITCGTKAPPRKASLADILRGFRLVGRIVLFQLGDMDDPKSDSCLQVMVGWHRDRVLPELVLVRIDQTRDKAKLDEYYGPRHVPLIVLNDTGGILTSALGITPALNVALVDKYARVRYRGELPNLRELGEWVGKLRLQDQDLGPNAPFFVRRSGDPRWLFETTMLLPVHDTSGPIPLTNFIGPNGSLILFLDTKTRYASKVESDLPTVAGAIMGQGIPTVIVCVGEDPAEVRTKFPRRIPGVPVLCDTSSRVRTDFQVERLPQVLLTDVRGQVVYRGPPDWLSLERRFYQYYKLPPHSVYIVPPDRRPAGK